MNKISKNRFYFNQYFGIFLGELSDNTLHKHYAQQISISCHSPLTVILENGRKLSKNGVCINANIPHQLISKDIQLTILINPVSPIGHQFHLNLFDKNDVIDTNDLLDEISLNLNTYLSKSITFETMCKQLEKNLNKYQCSCEGNAHLKDDRVQTLLDYFDLNFERSISLKKAADFCHLSPTRFQHLFKEKTNLSFRRYQLWNRLIKSLPFLMEHSITDTAYEFGFSDSAHYTRTFKESFGVTPKFLLQ